MSKAAFELLAFHLLTVFGKLLLELLLFRFEAALKLEQAERVNVVGGIVPDEFVKVASIRPDSTASLRQQSSVAQFVQRVSVWPAASAWAVNPVFIENAVRRVIRPLGREPEGVLAGGGAGHADRLTKWPEFIASGFSTSGGTDKSNYVPVSVVRGEMRTNWRLEIANPQQTAHTACSTNCSEEIKAQPRRDASPSNCRK